MSGFCVVVFWAGRDVPAYIRYALAERVPRELLSASVRRCPAVSSRPDVRHHFHPPSSLMNVFSICRLARKRMTFRLCGSQLEMNQNYDFRFRIINEVCSLTNRVDFLNTFFNLQGSILKLAATFSTGPLQLTFNFWTGHSFSKRHKQSKNILYVHDLLRVRCDECR